MMAAESIVRKKGERGLAGPSRRVRVWISEEKLCWSLPKKKFLPTFLSILFHPAETGHVSFSMQGWP